MERQHEGGEPARPAPQQAPQTALGGAGAAERVLALQRSAGNHAVTRLVQGRATASVARALTMPLGGGVPAGAHATDFSVFLTIIRAEEARLPPAEAADTRTMITKLRKLFYGAPGWDSYLIPGAAGVAPLYGVQEQETRRAELEIPDSPNLTDYVEKKQVLVGAPAALADPASIQEVRMPNGDFVDVGHVLAGLDALNHPGPAAGPGGLFNVASNVGAVTWIGDLGSIVGECIVTRLTATGGRSLTDAEIQAEIDRMAPGQDMLGNVDAYVIGATLATGGTGLRVSDMLEQYYGGAGVATPAGESARNQRFTIFANQVGLGALSGTAFVNEATWKRTFLPQVQNAAGLYMGAVTESSGGPFGMAQRGGLAIGASLNPASQRLLDVFVDELKTRVRAEAATAVPAGP